MEQKIRKIAIKRYLDGESPKSIYTDLKRSKHWFFKWLNRYKTGDANWHKDQSRAPKNRPKQTGEIEKHRFIEVNQYLESQKFSLIEPSSIK
mgnify:CR=1 FL=1